MSSQSDRGCVKLWLSELGALCASNLSVADVQQKITLYAKHLSSDFGSGSFNQRSLRHVAARCKFFPTYGELVDALREWGREQRTPHGMVLAHAAPEGTPRLEGPVRETPAPYEPVYHGYGRARAGEPEQQLRHVIVDASGMPKPVARCLPRVELNRRYAAEGLRNPLPEKEPVK